MSTNTNPTPRTVPGTVKPRTETEERLWRALLRKPGSTAVTLSITAGIGRSTAPKILTRWESEGLVARTPGIADGGSRPADRWSITTHDTHSDNDQDRSPDDGSTGLLCSHEQPAASGGPAQTEAWSKGERLAPGALRGMVEDHLREHPGRDFSPNAMAKSLSRSAGAVHNALEKLVAGGYAVRTSDKPRKYAITPAPGDPTAH